MNYLASIILTSLRLSWGGGYLLYTLENYVPPPLIPNGMPVRLCVTICCYEARNRGVLGCSVGLQPHPSQNLGADPDCRCQIHAVIYVVHNTFYSHALFKIHARCVTYQPAKGEVFCAGSKRPPTLHPGAEIPIGLTKHPVVSCEAKFLWICKMSTTHLHLHVVLG